MELSLVVAGESHGPGITAIVSGLPAGLPVDREAVRRDLARRQAGYGRSPRQQIERDDIEVLGGLRHGRTLGGPVALLVRNRDHANWGAAMDPWPVDPAELEAVAARRSRPVVLPRPGHADLAGALKFGHDDIRNVLERASARETAARVAAGSVASGLLRLLGVRVAGRVVRLGDVEAPPDDGDETAFDRARDSELGCSDPATEERMRAAVDAAREDRDTLGGLVEVRAFGVPPGLGSYTEPRLKLDARLGGALLGIQAMKAVEIGDGLATSRLRRSRGPRRALPRRGARLPPHHQPGRRHRGRDVERRDHRRARGHEASAHADAAAALGPPRHPRGGGGPGRALRHDRHRRAAVVAEAAVAFELTRAVRETFGGDHVDDVTGAWRAYLERIPWRRR